MDRKTEKHEMGAVCDIATPLVLAVDDDVDHLALVERWLQLANVQVRTATCGRDALALLEMQRPDLVLTDLVMDEMDGLRLLSEIHRQDPVMPVMILSGRAAIPDALKAAHLGVTAFLIKPIKRDELIAEVTHALETVVGRRAASGSEFSRNIVHRSQLMREVLGKARLVAAADSSILITGETGTGKEVLAKAIHEGSPRCKAAFVSINCSALPEQLLESELFGHEKGAFTGAVSRHKGLFQTANKGTLFLDEIGDMPLSLQAKLLRVLQDFQVRPVGSLQAVFVDVRLVSATNRDLEDMMSRGEFRADLYYRLNVVPLHLPSLRERREDIPLLIDHFLREIARRQGCQRKRLSPHAIDHLVRSRFPGNIRQLQNIVEQCSVLSTSGVIPARLVSDALRDQPGDVLPLDEAKLSFERRYLVGVLRTTEGNVTGAAKLAGRNRTEFYKLLHRHGLDPADFRAELSSGNDS